MMTLKEAAQIVSNVKAGKLSIDDMAELLATSETEGMTNALLLAYNAGYYRGASAVLSGQFSPEKDQPQIDKQAASRIINIKTGKPTKVGNGFMPKK